MMGKRTFGIYRGGGSAAKYEILEVGGDGNSYTVKIVATEAQWPYAVDPYSREDLPLEVTVVGEFELRELAEAFAKAAGLELAPSSGEPWLYPSDV
jgi:hypothetical protein